MFLIENSCQESCIGKRFVFSSRRDVKKYTKEEEEDNTHKLNCNRLAKKLYIVIYGSKLQQWNSITIYDKVDC